MFKDLGIIEQLIITKEITEEVNLAGYNISDAVYIEQLMDILKNANSVTKLDLSANCLNHECIEKLAQGLPETNITTLYLRANKRINAEGEKDGKLSADTVRALATALPNTKITELCLSGNEIDNEGATNLFNSLPNTKIVNLKLHYNKIDDNGVEALAEALTNPETKLTTLDLSENRITGTGVESLARALPNSNLTELDLHRDSKFWIPEKVCALELTGIIEIKFGDSIAQALASTLANPKTKLTKLNINGNEVSNVGIEAIASALAQNPETSLTELRIDGNIGDGGKSSAYMVHSMPGITDEGVIKLAAVLPKTSLKILSLNKNAIGDLGAKELAAVLPESKLTELSLRTNKVGDDGAIALFSALPYSLITSLILHGNKIGPNAAQVLAEILPNPNIKITEIDLNCNEIGDLGLEAIAGTLLSSNIEVLRVNDNKIGDDGAQALVRALNYNVAKPKLTHIVIENNKITNLVKANLCNAVAAANLEINIEYYSPVRIKEITGQVAINTTPQSNTETLLLYPYFSKDVLLNEFSIIENLMIYPKVSTLIIRAMDPLNINKLCEVLPQTRITKLIITDSKKITSAHIQQLASILPETEITNLAIDFVDDGGAQVLATALPSSKLTTLSLSYNPIGDDGAQALATALLKPNTKLINLNLQNCKITHNGGLILITAWKQYLDQVANDPEGQGITTHYMNLVNNELFSALNGEGINDIIGFIAADVSLVRSINFINDGCYLPSKKVHRLLLDFQKMCELSIAKNDEQSNEIELLIEKFNEYLGTALDEVFADYPLIGLTDYDSDYWS
ncbi:Putative leucine-rich repeats protein [Candidatus Trichorickettsia mobilis]|uniref:Leucine-rich repeats protein n=1 Tax=Candidatus Trichorickettsia mobilis TaxID=1346319 RepID=A0ABZ0UQ89_9RICK|nr:hypothetical protein [Candidatus Trichorickettsia mobilis]WPY00210.1 Putative leucine-rich repeats protein [Candidatus Trichorickettsia mobilis]